MSRKGIPKISVVIPCYNLGHYLEQAINSVLEQTEQDFEIIIVNPASTDDFTDRLLSNYQRAKTIVIQTERVQAGAARNCGIREARGKYICCLDADDTLKATFLEKASAVLDKEGSVGFVGCWYEAFGEESWISEPERYDLEDFLVRNPAPVSSLFRKEAWKEAGGYDERLEGYEDWEFWINLLAHGYHYYMLEEPLFQYRVRNNSKVRKSNLPKNRDIIMRLIIGKHREVFQKNAIAVLLGKERFIGRLLDYQRQLTNGQLSYPARIKEYEERINLMKHELRSVYASRAWKLGYSFQEARRSVRGGLLLPFRIIDISFPGLKKFLKKIF